MITKVFVVITYGKQSMGTDVSDLTIDELENTIFDTVSKSFARDVSIHLETI